MNRNSLHHVPCYHSVLRKALGHAPPSQPLPLVHAKRFVRRAAPPSRPVDDGEPDVDVMKVIELEIPGEDEHATGADGVARAHKIKKHADGQVEMSAMMPRNFELLPRIDTCSPDEVSKQFNLFAQTVDGCTQEDFLRGVEQSYYVLGQMTEQLTLSDKRVDLEGMAVPPRKSASSSSSSSNNNNSTAAAKTAAMTGAKSGEKTFANGTTTALHHARHTLVANGAAEASATNSSEKDHTAAAAAATTSSSSSRASERQHKQEASATPAKETPPPELFSGKTTADALHVAQCSRHFLNTLQSVYDLPRDESEWRPQSQHIVRFWEHVKYSPATENTGTNVAATAAAASKKKAAAAAAASASSKATATATATAVDLRQQRAEHRQIVKERTQQAAHDMEASSIKRAVGAVTSLLPLSGALAETYFKAYALQRKQQLSTYMMAGPNDYILNPRIGMFITFPRRDGEAAAAATQVGEGEQTALDAPAKEKAKGIRTRRRKETAHGALMQQVREYLDKEEEGSVQVLFSDDTPCEFNLTLTLDNQVADDAAEAEKAADHSKDKATAAAAEELEDDDGNSKSILELTMGETTLSPIPASARACAAVWMDVVVPPGRTNKNYDFFYKRVQDTETEYERVAISRTLAQHAPMWLFASLDFLVRMFTGRQSEFTFSKKHAKMIGVPDRIAECPPVQRKLLLMYMDAAKRWVLSDMVVVGDSYAGLREDEK